MELMVAERKEARHTHHSAPKDWMSCAMASPALDTVRTAATSAWRTSDPEHTTMSSGVEEM